MQSHLFTTIRNEGTRHLSWLKEQFKDKIEPIYGDQTASIDKIIHQKDRICDILLDDYDNTPIGVVVFKKYPTDEFNSFGVRKSTEIKTLFLAEPEKQTGKGYHSALLQRVIDYAHRQRSCSVHVAVCQKKQDSIQFFTHKGFKKVHTWSGKYQQGCNEYLFVLNLRPILYKLPLKEPYLSQIIIGKKLVEGRINCGIFKRVAIGDVILFENRQRGNIKVVIESIHIYKDFPSMIKSEGLHLLLPDVSNIDEAVKIYRNLPQYTEKEKRFGVVAIGISTKNIPESHESKIQTGKSHHNHYIGNKRLREEQGSSERNVKRKQ
jgi:ASC-1-like (ASCH) protein/GNAT superfamily N-acetyltransferase